MKSRCRRNTILSDTIVSMYMIMIRCVSLRLSVSVFRRMEVGSFQDAACFVECIISHKSRK